MSIPSYRDLDIESLSYSDPTLVGRRHIARARNTDESEVVFDTPVMEVKNGFCISEDRCYLELVLKRRDSKFYNFLVDVGDSGITTTFKSSNRWFGNTMPFDIVDDYHRSVVKLSRDKGVATIKCKVPYNLKRNRIGIKVLNQEGKERKQTTVQDGVFVVARLRYNGLRFLKQMFTEEYELVRLTVQEGVTEESLDNKYNTSGYDFGFDQYDAVTVAEEDTDELLKEYEEEDEQPIGEETADPVIEEIEAEVEVEAEEKETADHVEEEVEVEVEVEVEDEVEPEPVVEDDQLVEDEAEADPVEEDDQLVEEAEPVIEDVEGDQPVEEEDTQTVEEAEVETMSEEDQGVDKDQPVEEAIDATVEESQEEAEINEVVAEILKREDNSAEEEELVEKVLDEERNERRRRHRRHRHRRHKESKSGKRKKVLILSGGRTRDL